MKKTNRIKVIALLVTVVMLLQALGTSAIITTSAATEPLYETKFNETFDTLKTGDVWGVETKRNPSKASEPTVADGVMKFDKKDSVKFTWTKVDGAGAYSSSNKYVFEFDVKITNSGEGFEWDNASYTRAMYVAFGGWYNQIEVNNKDGKFRVGDTYTDYSTSTFEGKTVHYKVLLEGETITSYAYNADGSLISSGSRTSASYTNMTSEYEAMTYLVIRCEDGEFELDNFSFTVENITSSSHM